MYLGLNEFIIIGIAFCLFILLILFLKLQHSLLNAISPKTFGIQNHSTTKAFDHFIQFDLKSQ